MPEFSYVAKDRTGRTIYGTIQADNSALALGKVREMGYEVERVRPVQQECTIAYPPKRVRLWQRFAENFIYPVFSGVTLKELAIFYREFATLINAGLPLYRALGSLEGQIRNAKMREILRACQVQVERGGKLSDVFEGYPWVFSELQIEMIRAAEHGGMLERMLFRIAEYLEQELALRRLISRLTLYPKLVVLAALFILGASFFRDAMPAFSKLVVGQMGKMEYTGQDYLFDTVVPLAIAGAIIFGVVAFCRVSLFQSDAIREGYERLKLLIPGVGKLSRQFALAKFGRAFGAMYEAGLPIATAIRVAGDTSGSRMIARAIGRAITAVDRGAPLSQAFRETGVFPHIVLDMLHTGEMTGNVDAMMNKMAEYLEGDAETKANQYSHIFSMAVYLLVAGLVGFAIVRFYAGMAGSYGAIGGE